MEKLQTNWRIYKKVLRELEKDRVIKGFTSIPAFVNYLFLRYINGETIKRGK